MKKTRTEEVDRISELPEPILHHILSFLPFKQVALTCVLSKKWEETWKRYPVFKIDESILCEDERYREIRMKLLNYLEQTLQNRRCKDFTSMEKFSIDTKLFDDQELASFVDRCICYAIGSNVKMMKLEFLLKRWHELEFGLRRDSWYDLPPIVLCAKSVEV
ncbi:hypothetical protein Ddye_014374 [Dipteronia dyeriana]|uniref:F-box domain-containing protein n=1 Tax=Dipteronia dyeriana TaxID=168575 RepID=A0AAD9X8Q0_9ROSI|nr:hypothetical protein Ddye_014374 [Dipteronia dyeriana]